jgi:hypothetical protein
MESSTLRTILTDAFTDEELKTLCFDHIRPVYNQLAVGMTKGEIIQLLIEHCERRKKTDWLIALVRHLRPMYFGEPGQRAASTPDTPAMVAETSGQAGRHPLRLVLANAQEDAPIVRELYRRLCNDGFDVWFDEESLVPGENWMHAIPNAIQAAHVLLVCISMSYLLGENFKRIHLALETAMAQPAQAITIIPVKLQPGHMMPEHLSHLHSVPLYGDFDAGYTKLLLALRSLAEYAYPA